MVNRSWGGIWKLKRNKLSPTVLISYTKNKKILDQIKQMLQFINFDYEVGVEREPSPTLIPEKTFNLMRKCNCAIINLSADNLEKSENGSYDINQNILVEIGAAFLAYDKRVILLLDKSIKLPNSLKGLYYSTYEKDELSWKNGTDLQKALAEFRDKL